MAGTATKFCTFPLFSRLPPELRDQIWREALPGSIGPGLHFYKKGCWCPRHLTASDEGYDPSNDELNLNFEFRYDLLDDMQFEAALVSVNREARDIALGWAREQGLEIRRRDGGRQPVFVRAFDPTRDALYVGLGQWDDFITEPSDRCSEPDLVERLVTVATDVRRVAVPEELLPREGAWLAEVFQYCDRIEALLVVVDEQPHVRSADEGRKVQHWWEYESTREGALFWNHDRRDLEWTGGRDGDEGLYKLIEEVKNGLRDGLVKNHMQRFEVRPVVAISRS